MTNAPDDDPLPERMHDAARGYHAPHEVPREEMWTAIAAGRAHRRAVRVRVRWGLALAAMLVIGIGIGRMLVPAGVFTRTPAATAAASSSTPYRVAAGQYFARTEVLLTELRSEGRRGRPSAEYVASARDLLSVTRLMLDSPAADDPRVAALLQDLELVLAQISQLPADQGKARRGDLDLIDQSITQSSVLTRLRAQAPGAGLPTRTEGVL